LSHTIRRITISSRDVTTIAGKSGNYGSTDGFYSFARFKYPAGLVTVANNLYISDTGNYTIRKMDLSTGEVTTLAGMTGVYGSLDGTGSGAQFNGPRSLTSDGINLYIADTGNHTIRKISIATGEVTTIAGKAGTPGGVDGTGSEARFYSPSGITGDGIHLYVADSYYSLIRKIVISTGQVTILAGQVNKPGSFDGIGTAALVYHPSAIITNGINLYFIEEFCVRKIE
jgi:hypothetical protein